MDNDIGAKVAHVKQAGQTRGHTCHWPGCHKQVPPAMWGCATHWYKLPTHLRDRIWRSYQVGQETTLTPSREYVAAARDVQAWIAASTKEHDALARHIRARIADRKELPDALTIKTLIVEDSPLIAQRVERLLQQHRHVHVVANVSREDAALDVCDRQRIDLAVLDLQLDQGTGFGVIHKLREKGRANVTCIIVLTNHAVPALKVAAFEAGADYFLDKTKEFEALPRLVQEIYQHPESREMRSAEWDRVVGPDPAHPEGGCE